MKKLAVLAAILLCGCGTTFGSINSSVDYQYTMVRYENGTKVVPVYMDIRFSAEHKRAVEAAIAHWNYALNGNIRFVIVSEQFDMGLDDIVAARKSGGLLIMSVDSDCPLIPKSDAGVVLAWTDVVGGREIYMIDDRLKTNRKTEGVAMHEIGHALGSADHVENGNSLMYFQYGDARNSCVDKDTVEEVAKYQHIAVETMNYCVR